MTRHYFAAFFLAAALAFATKALAAVTPLPGATPQHAPANQSFPNPIAVQVTDGAGRPAAGARVRWKIPQDAGLVMENPPTSCFYDVGMNCSVTAGPDGVGRLPSIRGSVAGPNRLLVDADLDGIYLGRAEIELITDPLGPTGRITPVQGSGQSAVIGMPFAQPFIARVVRADGSPRVGAYVQFRVQGQNAPAIATFPERANFARDTWESTTDAGGYAMSAPLTAGWGLGSATVTAAAFDEVARAFLITQFDIVKTKSQGGSTLSLQDMWWSGPLENGWGVSIAQQDDKLVALLFVYDDSGKPTWRFMSSGLWSAGIGSAFLGPLQTTRAAPYFDYDAARFAAEQTGSAELSFNGERSGTIRVIQDTSGLGLRFVVKKLERFDFSSDSNEPLRGVSGLWWGGPSQNGWGVSITEQRGGLFGTWFTYDESGRATWFVMLEGRWTSPNTFEGRMYRATSSPWFGVAYDASKFRAIDVGPYSLRFLAGGGAELQYNVDGRLGTLALERFPF